MHEDIELMKIKIQIEAGVVPPIEMQVVGGKLCVVSGHERYKAIMDLVRDGIDVPAVPVKFLRDSGGF
jgi:hypothetical protein